MKIKVIGILIVLIVLTSTASALPSYQDPVSEFITWLKNLIQGQSTAAITSTTSFAGWRSSPYGYQTQGTSTYWINVAKTMAQKSPGSTPAGIWLVGETDGIPPTDTGTVLYMPSSGTYPNIRFEGADISEPYLTAFDGAGIKVFLQVEPLNADINTLIDIVIGKYKNHPSVIGFAIDMDWYKTCSDGCKATALQVTSWNNKLHSYNSNYVLMLIHYDQDKLPTGIPTDIIMVDNSEQNGNLNTMIADFTSFFQQYPNNPIGSQIGSQSDISIWSSKTDPVKDMGTAIQTGIGRPISIFWSDDTITTYFPPATYNTGTPTPTYTSTPTVTPTPTATSTPTSPQTTIPQATPTTTPVHTPVSTPTVTPTQTITVPCDYCLNFSHISPLIYLVIAGILVFMLINNKNKKK